MRPPVKVMDSWNKPISHQPIGNQADIIFLVVHAYKDWTYWAKKKGENEIFMICVELSN